jgi:hypothetical protein
VTGTPRKTAKHRCAVGDVLAVPLPDGNVGYVRIINIKDGWDLAEVLAVTTPAASFDDAVQLAEALYPPGRIRVNRSQSEGPVSNADADELPHQEFYVFEMMVKQVMARLAAPRTVRAWLDCGPDAADGRVTT